MPYNDYDFFIFARERVQFRRKTDERAGEVQRKAENGDGRVSEGGADTPGLSFYFLFRPCICLFSPSLSLILFLFHAVF